MKTNISNFFKKYLENNNYTGVYVEMQTDKQDSGTAIDFKSDTYFVDRRQQEYATIMFLDEQARNDRLKKKHKIDGVKTPWYLVPKGFTFLFKKEHEELSDGEAYGRLAMKELRKERLKLALRYFKKACEKGISLTSKQRIQAIIQNYQRAHKSAVKGLKMPSTRMFRAVSNNTEKSEAKGNENYEKMRRLGLIQGAEDFKKEHSDKTYKICIQRKTSDEKYGIDGSYIFATEFIKHPKNMLQRYITDTYGRCRKDTSFERIYTIDTNGTINWYEKPQLEVMLENRVKEQEEYINKKAA